MGFVLIGGNKERKERNTNRNAKRHYEISHVILERKGKERITIANNSTPNTGMQPPNFCEMTLK